MDKIEAIMEDIYKGRHSTGRSFSKLESILIKHLKEESKVECKICHGTNYIMDGDIGGHTCPKCNKPEETLYNGDVIRNNGIKFVLSTYVGDINGREVKVFLKDNKPKEVKQIEKLSCIGEDSIETYEKINEVIDVVNKILSDKK